MVEAAGVETILSLVWCYAYMRFEAVRIEDDAKGGAGGANRRGDTYCDLLASERFSPKAPRDLLLK